MTLHDRLHAARDAGLARAVDVIAHDGPLLSQIPTRTPAAVLMAVTDTKDPGLILTQRPQSMRKHPGQVAFPGGRVDPEDADVFAAALREAEEEVALPRSAVTIIGPMDLYRTVTGYEITPVLALVPGGLDLVANADEVETIFEAPLAFLLDPANHLIRTLDWQGEPRSYYEMHWGEHRIWGATAAMIVNLSRRLSWLG